MSVLIVIPARMKATRLPNKPLADIGGVPMIVQVWRRAMESGVGEVVVACDGEEIAQTVRTAGGMAVITDPNHPSGSDRVWEVVSRGAYGDEESYEYMLDAALAHKTDLSEIDMKALERYASGISKLILAKAIKPLEGARLIWRATVRYRREGYHALDPFIYAESEAEDRPKEKEFFEKAIIEEAKTWASLQNDHDIIINLQGDLPTFEPHLLRDLLRPLENPAVDISTLVAEITRPEEHENPSVVKAVIALKPGETSGKALYFTRLPAPYGDGPRYHHIGVYAYRRAALEKFVSLPPSPLETREKLEQLRALEAGLRIDAVVVNTVPLGVDTPEDLARAREILRSR